MASPGSLCAAATAEVPLGLGRSGLNKELNVPFSPQERQRTAVKVPGNLSVPRVAVCAPVWMLEAEQ